MKRKKGLFWWGVLTLFFLFLSLGQNFLHNHCDLFHHGDCPICQWNANILFIFILFIVFIYLSFSEENNYFFYKKVPVSKVQFYLFFKLRSPPRIIL